MPHWLTQASKVFSRPRQDDPIPFEIRCSCGQAVCGLRQNHSQQKQCKQCGSQLFVLPRDAYPQPKPVRTRKKNKKSKKGREAEAATAKANRARMRERLREGARRVGNNARQVRTRAKGILIRAANRQRAFFTPFRLILLTVVLIVGATVYWVVQKEQLEAAQTILKDAQQKGLVAMREQDFATAEQELQKACRALDLLERDDAPARAIRQLSREATAANNLSHDSLFEVVDDMDRESKQSAKDLDKHFRSVFQNRWFVMEAAIERVSSLDGDPAIEIDFPISINGKRIVIDASLPLFERVLEGQQRRNVVFAAQLESCRLEKRKPSFWKITLRPESVFLWTDLESLQAMGFENDRLHPEEATRQLLEEQSQLMGIER